jgi:AraC-like DNA-binding protein
MTQKKNNLNSKYFVRTPADETWGTYVTTVGYQSLKPNSKYPPSEHPSSYWFNPVTGRTLQEYQILYITNGEGTFESKNCKSIKINSGTIIFLFPNEKHTYKPSKNTGWEEYWIGFNGQFIEHLHRNNFISKLKPIYTIGFNEQLITLIQQAIEIANFQKPAYQQMLAGIVGHIIATTIYTEKNNAFRDKESMQLIEKAKLLIRTDADYEISPTEIAKKLNISYSWFRRIFRKYTGLSPLQYLAEIKVQKSKELLNGTSMTIKEIAYALNFSNPGYFVTFFKAKTGWSPGHYRNAVHGKEIFTAESLK